MKCLFFFPVCVICILSCASSAGKDVLYVNLTKNSKFVLLPPDGIEHNMDMAQYLSAEFRGQNYFLNSWVKANENAIEMTFFNEMGASMGELTYRNGEVHFSSSVLPKSVLKLFKPEYVVADFQLCFYDPFLLKQSLKDSGLVMETRDGYRGISNGKKVIIEIIKTGNTVELVNHLQKYAYTLEGDFYGVP